jgi:hypothetical protein
VSTESSPTNAGKGVLVNTFFLLLGLAGVALLCAALLDAAEYDTFLRSLLFL